MFGLLLVIDPYIAPVNAGKVALAKPTQQPLGDVSIDDPPPDSACAPRRIPPPVRRADPPA